MKNPFKSKYKYSFDRIVFHNRWKIPKHQRSDDWLIIGFDKWWFSPNEFEYRIGFLGFDCRIWIKRGQCYEKPV